MPRQKRRTNSKWSLKTISTNVLLVSGIISAATGSAKSVIELMGITGCAKPPVQEMKVGAGPSDTGSSGSKVLDSMPEPPPVIMYHYEEPKPLLPAPTVRGLLIAFGVLAVSIAIRMKRRMRKEAENAAKESEDSRGDRDRTG